MYNAIVCDYLRGVINSCKINLLITSAIQNSKLAKLLYKIIKYNFILYVLPLMLVQILNIFDLSFYCILNFISYPIGIFSAVFHLLHYMDLMNIVCTNSSKSNNEMPVLDLISLAITMSLYNIVIYLTTNLINLFFHERIYILAIMLNFIILTIYHSFYCFNNLWQYKKIEMAYRIDMHEKLWAYYMGYGTIATIIYLYVNNFYVMGLYNLYMTICISMPFMIEPRYPSKTKNYPNYPSINLVIFSYIVGYIFSFTKYILRFTRASS